MGQPPVSEHDPRRFDSVSPAEALGPPTQTGAGVIAIGASAGGVEALRAVVEGLPPELPTAVLVVLHRYIRDSSDRRGPGRTMLIAPGGRRQNR